jgi:hypothetical protein
LLQIKRVSPLASLLHLLSFFAPAAVVAAFVALAARVVLPPAARPRSWGLAFVLNFVAGGVVLSAGLWYFGHDGKMATYAALVLAVASTQWLAGRAWRG